MRKFGILLAALLLLSALSVSAQEEEEERDVLEMNFGVGVGIPGSGISDWMDTLGAKTGWSLGMDIGYFLSPKMVLGFNFTYYQFTIDGNDQTANLHHRFYSPSAYLKYYFEGESNLVPYLKLHAGVENPKFTTWVSDGTFRYREKSYDPTFAFGIGAGAFYYTSDYSGLFIEANYHQAITKNTTATFGGNTYDFGTNAGLIDIHAGVRILISKG